MSELSAPSHSGGRRARLGPGRTSAALQQVLARSTELRGENTELDPEYRYFSGIIHPVLYVV